MAVSSLSGCSSYLFRQSDRVTVDYPGIYSTVKEPLEISWHAHAFSAPADGSFGVFLDRDPMPPGRGLEYFDPADRDRIWVVDRTSLHLAVLAARAGVDPAEQNHHDVSVVLLDHSGRRVGEYVGFSEFNVRR